MNLFLMIALVTMAFVGSSQAQNIIQKGVAQYAHIDFQMEGVPAEDTLVLQGDVARIIFNGMVNPVAKRVYDNICMKSGKSVAVQVEQRSGQTFGCEKWPATCWGATYYKCESMLDLETGYAKMRQSN